MLDITNSIPAKVETKLLVLEEKLLININLLVEIAQPGKVESIKVLVVEIF